jgi:hypothetical protein
MLEMTCKPVIAFTSELEEFPRHSQLLLESSIKVSEQCF